MLDDNAVHCLLRDSHSVTGEPTAHSFCYKFLHSNYVQSLLPDCNTVARIPRKCKLSAQHIFGKRNLSDKVLFSFCTLHVGPVSDGDCVGIEQGC